MVSIPSPAATGDFKPYHPKAAGTTAASLDPSGTFEFVEQRLCLFEVGRAEAFGEPAVDRREQIAGFAATALVAAEPGEAHHGAQFPELGLLLPGDAEGFAIEFLGGLGMPLPQQQLAFLPVQLRSVKALSRSLDGLQCIVQQDQGLVD